MEEKLTKKEQDFCRYYFHLRSPREAAALAGFILLPERCGEKLLEKKKIKDEIKRLEAQDSDFQLAKAGFKRLAFGSVADAIRLIDGDRENLDGLDLFMISDIKIPKGGGMEIKFFDRQKALESLASMENTASGNSTLPFYEALERSASFLSGTPEKASLKEADLL